MKEKVFNLLLLFLPLWTMAQNSYNISGTVTDAEQTPLAGATIKFMKEGRKSEIQGTTTGNDGRFTLQLPKGNYEMEVSYLGYADHLSTVRLNVEENEVYTARADYELESGYGKEEYDGNVRHNAQGGNTDKAFYPGYTQRSSGNYSTFRASLNLRYLFRWGKKSPRMGSRGNLEENARLGE